MVKPRNDAAGRTRTAPVRDKTLRVMVSAAELKLIQIVANGRGVSVSDFVRGAIARESKEADRG